MSSDSLKPPAKCTTPVRVGRAKLPPARERDRFEFVAFRLALDWSQEATARFLGCHVNTVRRYESLDPEQNRAIASVHFNAMRREARARTGLDSMKLKVVGQ